MTQRAGRSDTTLRFAVEGLHCAACVGRVETALRGVEGVKTASVNLATSQATVTEAAADSAAMVAAIQATGFKAVSTRRTLSVTGLHCASCVGRVEASLKKQPGVIAATVNLANASAQVTLLDPSIDLIGAVEAAGFAARDASTTPHVPDRSIARRNDIAALTRDVWVATALASPIVLVDMGGHVVPAFQTWIMGPLGTGVLHGSELALTSVLLAWPGRRFFVTGLRSLWRFAPDMNALVALGAGAAYLFSLVVTLWPRAGAGTAVYFEAAAVVVTLILLGRLLEARAKGKTGAAIERLEALQPATAHRLLPDGSLEEVAVADLTPGDRLVVRPGERIPADGVLDGGPAYIDESLLTGESRQVAKTDGAAVTGGAVNGTGSFTFTVRHLGEDTVLARIRRMVEDAQGAKLPVQALADRVVAWFVPVVIVIALITFAAWLACGASVGMALTHAVAVLVISCPCAMGLATPVSIMVATGRAAELGILFRRGEALQTLSSVEVVAFDKTGTLTQGKPSLVACDPQPGFARDRVLALAAALESRSEHPLASAILAAAASLPRPLVETAEARPGLGLAGRVEGQAVLIGSSRFMRESGVTLADGTVEGALYLAVEKRLAAIMRVADAVKPDAAATIAALTARGLICAMITGDARTTADEVAGALGIQAVRAEVLPGDKVAALSALAHGRRVAFVGDGLNDAPVLAEADVGLAIGTGTDVAIETADIVLVADRLATVTRAIELARATMRNIRQNLFWAFAYNVVLIPVAGGVLYAPFRISLSPMLSAGAMAFSSLFVVMNALRLRRFARVASVPDGSKPTRTLVVEG